MVIKKFGSDNESQTISYLARESDSLRAECLTKDRYICDLVAEVEDMKTKMNIPE